MKNFLVVAFLLVSTACWSQTASNVQSVSTVKTDSADMIYTSAEQMPQYPGGDKKLYTFLRNNIHYPAEAKDKNIQGTVYISFVVLQDGTLSDIKVVHGIDGGISEEAIRVVKLMPKWIPGTKNGKTVNVLINLPVSFQLSQD